VLEDHLDISRGDLLYAGAGKPHAARKFQARVVWMDAHPLFQRRRYLIKHTTRTVAAEFSIRHRVRIQTLEHEPAETLEMNEIGLVEVAAAQPLFFDPYSRNRFTGSFIIIDPETNATSGAGMIVESARYADNAGGPVTAAERVARWGHAGAVVRLGDRPALAHALERKLFDRGCALVILKAERRDAAAALAAAGILVLLLDGPDALPDDDAQAVDETIRRLETQAILRSTNVIHEGEGI